MQDGVAVKVPGALTPTEVVTAWELGASFVKLFPAGRFGPAYVKDLRGPLPQVDLLAVGGVSLTNARQFIEAGAVALGVGGELVESRLVAEKAFGVITERAKAFARLVTEGKGPARD